MVGSGVAPDILNVNIQRTCKTASFYLKGGCDG